MKLEYFSPLVVKLQQFVFMKRLTYIKHFFSKLFQEKQIYPLHHDRVTHFLKIINPETD